MTSAIRELSSVDGLATAAVPDRRFLCLPPAGGTLGTLREVAVAATGTEVWGVEYPGRGSRIAVPPPASIEELAEQLAGEFAGLFGPRGVARTVVAGFSMGAFVALELTRRVHARSGAAPAALVVVGALAPQRRVPGRYAAADADALARMLDRDGLTPAARESAEVREYALGLLRDDLRLTCAYRGPATATVPCPVAALCGADDPAFAGIEDETEAWREWATGPFMAGIVRGGHLGLLTAGRGTEFWAWMRRVERAVLEPEAGDD
ncbi:thioesterase II family protein [Amycolatopsis nigrescens]|uniref:thioesterase II family protein n=1 Tax=Amycolatopsis nigrescens TaxID=381445 RepID=UPI0003731F67|nr:alpha/beta fold hydrolase [Amycolatopsis nigrescens]